MLGITVDFDDARPVYRQIVEELRGLIARGTLAPGAELPSVRALGSRLGINQNTVAKAYRLLEGEGLVEVRHGSRARVAGTPSESEFDRADTERRIDDVISRLVLAGADRCDVERIFQTAINRFFCSLNTRGTST